MSKPEVGFDMLGRMLDALDFPVYTFDKDRKVLYANAATSQYLPGIKAGSYIGSAETNHHSENRYYDEQGNLLEFPRDSAVERALRGEETHEELLEHRNLKRRTHQWVSFSCVPVMEGKGNFLYGILWYREVSRRKMREDKVQFLLKATRVLSITTDFRQRLREKATLTVPTLADWCSIEIENEEGALERVALVHRDPQKIAWIEEYERRYPARSEDTAAMRVLRTGVAEFTPRVTDDMIENAPELSEAQKADIRTLELSSIMTLPIGEKGKTLGAFTLAYAESGREYTEEDFDFFKEFGQHLGVLLENARLYSEINQRDLYKDMFLASLSHELRNPLAPIKTSLELLKLRTESPEVTAELGVIEHQFDHMARLLNDLLDATRFVQGKIRIESSPLDLRGIVEQVTQAIRPVAFEKNIGLTITLPPLGVMVCADRTRVEQALTNILSNAVKFTPDHGRVSVSLAEEDGEAVIRVSDSGAGITPEERARIFEPYYQSERVKGGNMGLGIGLRLVQEIVRLHGGTIEAKSEGSDLGSEFIIKLPLSEDQDEVTETTMPEAPEEQTGKRILVIDDNKAAADALVRLFKALGWQAVAHYSAKEAFMHMDEEEVDLIFADIGMPEMNGYDFVKTLRENGYTEVPVVALTGYGLAEDREKALAAGFNEHLTKPVSADDLRRTVAALT